MNQRIRYSKVGTATLKSRRVFRTATGQDVTVELNLESKQFTVRDAASGVVVAQGGGTKNLNILKIKGKAALMSLGVNFAPEVRTRS